MLSGQQTFLFAHARLKKVTVYVYIYFIAFFVGHEEGKTTFACVLVSDLCHVWTSMNNPSLYRDSISLKISLLILREECVSKS